MQYQDLIDNARYTYQKATSVFIPVSQPSLRLQMADFEESDGKLEIAEGIYNEMISYSPNHFETLKKFVYFESRRNGIEAAFAMIDKLIEKRKENQIKSSLAAEKAKLMLAVGIFQTEMNEFMSFRTKFR